MSLALLAGEPSPKKIVQAQLEKVYPKAASMVVLQVDNVLAEHERQFNGFANPVRNGVVVNDPEFEKIVTSPDFTPVAPNDDVAKVPVKRLGKGTEMRIVGFDLKDKGKEPYIRIKLETTKLHDITIAGTQYQVRYKTNITFPLTEGAFDQLDLAALKAEVLDKALAPPGNAQVAAR